MMRAYTLLLGVVVWMGWINIAAAQGPEVKRPTASGEISPTGYGSRPSKVPLPVDLETLPETTRDAIAKVMQQPTITAVAPMEEFHSTGPMYLWLLDHPDRVSFAWKRLKVGAIDIGALDGDRFNWRDDQGSDLTWKTVAKNGEGRIWYAEGKVRPAALLPLVPVRAVAVLRHGVTKNEQGDPMIRHQVEVFLQTDSKTANLVTRMIGPAAPRMAEQGAEQMMLFFSGIARYVDRYPARAKSLLAEKK
jgi:hypothetical protein